MRHRTQRGKPDFIVMVQSRPYPSRKYSWCIYNRESRIEADRNSFLHYRKNGGNKQQFRINVFLKHEGINR